MILSMGSVLRENNSRGNGRGKEKDPRRIIGWTRNQETEGSGGERNELVFVFDVVFDIVFFDVLFDVVFFDVLFDVFWTCLTVL